MFTYGSSEDGGYTSGSQFTHDGGHTSGYVSHVSRQSQATRRMNREDEYQMTPEQRRERERLRRKRLKAASRDVRERGQEQYPVSKKEAEYAQAQDRRDKASMDVPESREEDERLQKSIAQRHSENTMSAWTLHSPQTTPSTTPKKPRNPSRKGQEDLRKRLEKRRAKDWRDKASMDVPDRDEQLRLKAAARDVRSFGQELHQVSKKESQYAAEEQRKHDASGHVPEFRSFEEQQQMEFAKAMEDRKRKKRASRDVRERGQELHQVSKKELQYAADEEARREKSDPSLAGLAGKAAMAVGHLGAKGLWEAAKLGVRGTIGGVKLGYHMATGAKGEGWFERLGKYFKPEAALTKLQESGESGMSDTEVDRRYFTKQIKIAHEHVELLRQILVGGKTSYSQKQMENIAGVARDSGITWTVKELVQKMQINPQRFVADLGRMIQEQWLPHLQDKMDPTGLKGDVFKRPKTTVAALKDIKGVAEKMKLDTIQQHSRRVAAMQTALGKLEEQLKNGNDITSGLTQVMTGLIPDPEKYIEKNTQAGTLRELRNILREDIMSLERDADLAHKKASAATEPPGSPGPGERLMIKGGRPFSPKEQLAQHKIDVQKRQIAKMKKAGARGFSGTKEFAESPGDFLDAASQQKQARLETISESQRERRRQDRTDPRQVTTGKKTRRRRPLKPVEYSPTPQRAGGKKRFTEGGPQEGGGKNLFPAQRQTGQGGRGRGGPRPSPRGRSGGRGTVGPSQPDQAAIDADWRGAGFRSQGYETQETMPAGGDDKKEEGEKLMLKKFSTAVYKKLIKEGMMRRQRPQQPVVMSNVPRVLTVPTPMPMPIPSSGEPVPKKKASDAAKVIIKQTVTQRVGETKARRKKADTKTILRKQYNKLKKSVSKDIRKRKALEYSKALKNLSGTKSEKASRRKAIKNTLQKKLNSILAKMPSSAKKDSKELNKMIREIKRLKW